MSRGGRRGGGAGGRRTGPDLSWEDEPIMADKKKPGPLFPELNPPLSVPKPLSSEEASRVNAYLSFRETMRNSKIYAVLGTNSFTDSNGKLNKRAGFDAFTGMEKYSARFDKPTRTVPDLSGRTYHLPFFPREMWSLLDPDRQSPAWRKRKVHSIAQDPRVESPTASRKRKRPLATAATAPLPSSSTDGSDSDSAGGGGGAASSENESDAPIPSTRKRRKKASSARRQPRGGATDDQEKSGLEAEDDIPDADPFLNSAGGAGDDEDGMGGSEVSDAVFSDDEGGDYAAEGYFDDGMGDDGFGDDGDGGGGGEGTFD